MRTRPVLLLAGVLVLSALGCGGGTSAATDAGPSPGADAGTPGVDAGAGTDAGPGVDGGADGGGLASDAGTTPEVCTGGLDEDGDTATDCADADCWDFADCVASDVATHAGPGLFPCGDPIDVDAAASATACATLGTPMGSTYPTECSTGSLTATARVFCDESGAPAALWIEERLSAPETQEMTGPRTFREVYWERASVVDWERQVSGASSREGGAGFPVHDGQTSAPGGGTAFTVVTVRTALAGDVISRLLGMQEITSLIDLDMPMSTDTRRTAHLGGLTITVPTP